MSFPDGDVFVCEAVGDDLGVELFEFSHGGALLQAMMQGLVCGGLEFVGEIGGIWRESGLQRVKEAGSNGRIFGGE